MRRFVIRRVAAASASLFVISVLTFLIFQTIPNGDPALRIGGRLATAQEIAPIRHEWGFDKPIYVQYVRTMEKIFTARWSPTAKGSTCPRPDSP